MIPARQQSPRRVERCFAVMVLFFLTEALWPVINAGGLNPVSTITAARIGAPSSVGVQALFGAIYVVTVALILPRLGLFLGLCRKNMVFLPLIALALMSTLWSAEPELSFRKSVAVLGSMGFAIYLVMRFTPAQLLRLLAWALGIAAVLSFVFAVALPEFGLDRNPHEVLWQGVYGHKNRLGFNMALGMLIFLVLASERGSYRLLAWAGMGLCGFLLAMSGARGAWVVVVLLIIFLAFFQVQRKTHYSVAVPALILGLCVFAGGILVVMTNLEFATASIGRDATLTNRTFIWSAVIENMDRPILGYGYSAFWHTQAASAARSMLWATINNAHNGFLTLWLDLGFAGIGALLLTVLVGLRRLIGRLPHERGLVFGSAWLPALFTYCLLYMIPVTTMAGNNIVWTLYVATHFYWTGPPAAIKAVGRQVGKVAIMNRFEDRKVGARP